MTLRSLMFEHSNENEDWITSPVVDKEKGVWRSVSSTEELRHEKRKSSIVNSKGR